MKKHVSIAGAGFSGLVSAFYLARAGYDVEIFEASGRAGGLLGTKHVQGALIETAANALLNSPLVEELFDQLQLPMIGTLPSARKRFIFRDGKVRRWPLSLGASLRVAFFVLRYALFRSSVAPREGETVSAWGSRVLGREASMYLVDAALQGIYAGDPSRMSASLIFRRFFFSKTQAPRPSRRLNFKGSVTCAKGLQDLIEALCEHLRSRGVRFHFNTRAQITETSSPWILATNAHDAAEILAARSTTTRERLSALRQVEYSPVVTTTALFRQTDAATRGFGVLFPPIEKTRALGVLKNNFTFAGRVPEPFYSETWIQGGALNASSINESGCESAFKSEAVLASIVEERSKKFGLKESPLASLSTFWREGIPHYTTDLEKLLPILNRVEDNIFLMGNYLGDIGLSKILERASDWPQRLEKEGHWT